MSDQFNIYCDESSVDGDKERRYMVIGALIIPRDKKKDFSNKFKSIIEKHSVGEIKWTNISKSSFKVSQQVADLFFGTEYASYTAIVVDKSKIDFEFYHEGSKELAFYKFYYILLKQKLYSGNKYYIYLDKKPVSVANRVGVLKSFLTGFIKSFRNDCVIKHLQEYPSHENKLIQITDLFTGAIASEFNIGDKLKSNSKKEFIFNLEKKLNRKLNVGTSPIEAKFNVFIWRPSKP
ncbi:DUF3800 domain-containing protein [Candidatus Woesebacteria bacterium]|nr:DUF3800 domain-containing protein [Candidatus Woesebacteria bacterium]